VGRKNKAKRRRNFSIRLANNFFVILAAYHCLAADLFCFDAFVEIKNKNGFRDCK
jgi:hypothetical protein